MSMGNDKNVTFVNENNLLNTVEVDVLCAFEYEDNKYIVYSKNEKDFDGNEIIYSGKIEFKNDKQYIKNINGIEYEKVKDIIKKMINYSGDGNDV